MNNTPAKHTVKYPHVVPRRHLKNFVISNDTKLECFNTDALRLEKQQSPKSICKGFFHYSIKPGKEDEYGQMVEKAFGDIEDWYGKNIDRIEKLLLSRQELPDDDKYAVSWVIANFYFRGYKFRQETKQSLKDLMAWLEPTLSEHIYKECLEKHQNIFSGDETEKEIVKNVIENTLNIQAENTSYATNRAFDEGFANTLTHKKWRILINNSIENPFITGDEAVIEISNEQIPHPFSNGFLSLTHVFHLSPKIAIIASYPFNEEMHGQVIFEDVTNNKSEIYKNNLLYVNHTYKYCYAPKKDFFEWLINFEKTKK